LVLNLSKKSFNKRASAEQKKRNPVDSTGKTKQQVAPVYKMIQQVIPAACVTLLRYFGIITKKQ
jgi:hypothetical protein